MSARKWISVLAIGLLWPALGVAAQNNPAELTLRISEQARPRHPGDVVLITVDATHPLPAIEGEAFDRPIRFWPTAEPRSWQGLIGIGLGTKPGRYEVVVRSSGNDVAATGRTSLVVAAKRFATRRLSLPDHFVNPPADVQDRIKQEAQLLASLFAQSRSDRIWRGAFKPPVSGPPTSSFGRLTIRNGQPGSRHQGADFRAPEGTPVEAPNAGEVLLAAELYYSGGTVILDHGFGLFSLVAHLSRLDVQAGRRVARGDIIALTGATGAVTGPHLHWAVRLGELSIDPQSLIATVANVEDAADGSNTLPETAQPNPR